MKASRIAVIVLSVLLLGEAGLVIAEWMQLKALRQLSEHDDALKGEKRSADQRIAHLRLAVKQAQSAADKRRADAAAAKAKADGAGQGGRGGGQRNEMNHRWAEALLKSLDLKEFQAAIGTVDRAWNERNAGPFLRGLGLNPDQVNHMLDLMGQLMIAKMDANQSAAASDLTNDSRQALVLETQKDITAQIQAYLGDQQFAAFQQFNRETGVRAVASSLQTSLGYTAAPLTDAQSQQLVAAMYQTVPDAQKGDATGLGAMVPMGGVQRPYVSQAELDAARPILSTQQMAALQAI